MCYPPFKIKWKIREFFDYVFIPFNRWIVCIGESSPRLSMKETGTQTDVLLYLGSSDEWDIIDKIETS
ncbi:MAG: hypothetical protein CMB80_28595 [Flammeovirgaceae bacterium]|nr:hypothetical protein [Flammeovirgaceae bacterium]